MAQAALIRSRAFNKIIELFLQLKRFYTAPLTAYLQLLALLKSIKLTQCTSVNVAVPITVIENGMILTIFITPGAVY